MSQSSDRISDPNPPLRFIFNTKDMEQFKASSAKRELLSFVTALGRSTINSSYIYDPSQPLLGLSPGMASLHGSLKCISLEWIKDFPPNSSAKARFGDPMFKAWHARLVERSRHIIKCIMNCHMKYVESKQNEGSDWNSYLKQCSELGYQAASSNFDNDEIKNDQNDDTQHDNVLVELQSYIHPSFGHEIRLDYGTGYESSFFVFLYSLCKIGIFGNVPKTSAPTPEIMAPVALSIVSQYLEVCRGLQTEYWLEPAGSHGVWGLDDYNCIPFYIGACQLQNVSLDTEFNPSDIHVGQHLNSGEDKGFMYFQCIRYIKSLKKGVPFFESSPMLDDISHLANWSKVSSGLLRLYEGEVLNKMPVVQHFIFGNIFKATWTPSEAPRAAPSHIFIDGPDEYTRGNVMPPTKAPWAK